MKVGKLFFFIPSSEDKILNRSLLKIGLKEYLSGKNVLQTVSAEILLCGNLGKECCPMQHVTITFMPLYFCIFFPPRNVLSLKT